MWVLCGLYFGFYVGFMCSAYTTRLYHIFIHAHLDSTCDGALLASMHWPGKGPSCPDQRTPMFIFKKSWACNEWFTMFSRWAYLHCRPSHREVQEASDQHLVGGVVHLMNWLEVNWSKYQPTLPSSNLTRLEMSSL